MAYTATTDVAGFLPNYYSKVFLERLVPGPRMLQFCTMKPLPKNQGKVAYFPRMVVSSTTVSAYKLAEGTVITPEKIDDAQVSATIEQFGNSKAIWYQNIIPKYRRILVSHVIPRASKSTNK